MVVCDWFACGSVCAFIWTSEVRFTFSLVLLQKVHCVPFNAVLWAGGSSWRSQTVQAVGLRKGLWTSATMRCISSTGRINLSCAGKHDMFVREGRAQRIGKYHNITLKLGNFVRNVLNMNSPRIPRVQPSLDDRLFPTQPGVAAVYSVSYYTFTVHVSCSGKSCYFKLLTFWYTKTIWSFILLVNNKNGLNRSRMEQIKSSLTLRTLEPSTSQLLPLRGWWRFACFWFEWNWAVGVFYRWTDLFLTLP